jgi:hypothetical protein
MTEVLMVIDAGTLFLHKQPGEIIFTLLLTRNLKIDSATHKKVTHDF